MRSAYIGLLLLPALAVGCSSDKSPASVAAPPQTAVAEQPVGPTPAQIDQAKQLAAKLGCPDAEVTPAGGVPGGASIAEVDCDSPYRGIRVFADQQSRDALVNTWRSAFNPQGVQGEWWVVQVQTSDDEATVKQQVGGQKL